MGRGPDAPASIASALGALTGVATRGLGRCPGGPPPGLLARLAASRHPADGCARQPERGNGLVGVP
jgi:hypothetical protein